MNWKKIIGIIILGALIVLVVIKLKNNKEIAQQKVYQYDKDTPVTVSIDTIQLQEISNENFFTGTFEPNKESKISAEVQGKINSIFVEVGDYLGKKQPIVQLDHSLLKLQLQAIEVQIEGLQADVNRYTILANADAVQGIQLEKAILGLKSAKVQQAILQEQIDKTTIKSPFNGVVTAKLNEEGGFAAPGVPLVQITDIAELKFTINIPETELQNFDLNHFYKVTVDAIPDISLKGKLILKGSKANPGNSFPLQFSVKNSSDLKIKSGMFGKVHTAKSSDKQGIMIPTSSIFNEGEITKVYLVEDGKAVLKQISVEKNIGNKSVVSQGLQTDDIIITNGFINLFDGAKVVVK